MPRGARDLFLLRARGVRQFEIFYCPHTLRTAESKLLLTDPQRNSLMVDGVVILDENGVGSLPRRATNNVAEYG